MGVARQVFLPEGFPESVSSDYFEYQLWDTLQAFASSVSGSLATAAVLGGLGVGDSTATPLAATLTWILKDGAGMVGRIVFAAYSGTSLDFDCKRWRMFADILNDCVMCVELLAPGLPRPLVMPTLCVAGLGRSLVGVAGGATKAAVAQHQAKRNNMADLAAKDGSQETLVNLVALCVNLVLLPLVSGTPGLPFILFLVLASLHIYSNFRAVSCLVFTSLSSTRLHLLLDRYRETGVIESPATINHLEPVMRPGVSGHVSVDRLDIRLGVSLSEVKKDEVSQVQSMIDKEEPYCVIRRVKESLCATANIRWPGKNTPEYLIIISNLASPVDIYQAYLKCYLLLEDVDKIMIQMTESGWDLETLALNTEGFTLQFEV